MVRHLGGFHGRGIALVALGFSAGGASLPFLTVQLQDALGRRLVWAVAGVLLLPLAAGRWLLGSGDQVAVMYEFMALAALTVGAYATVTISA